MIDIFGGLTDIVADILKTIINFCTAPFLNILRDYIPNFNSYFVTAASFINNYIFKGFQWVKMCFLNLTGLSHGVWNLLVVSIGIILSFYGVILLVKLVYNVWSIFHGSQQKN